MIRKDPRRTAAPRPDRAWPARAAARSDASARRASGGGLPGRPDCDWGNRLREAV